VRNSEAMFKSASDGFSKQAWGLKPVRPKYHPALIERFSSRYGNGTVVEVGAGNGSFTRQLVGHGIWPIALEPENAVRLQLATDLPTVRAENGLPEATGLATGSASTVVAAEVFHHIDLSAVVGELHRILRRGGFLATVWNRPDTTIEWVGDYSEVLSRYWGDAPNQDPTQWRNAINSDPRFGLVDDWEVRNSHSTTPEELVKTARSSSLIGSLSPQDQLAVDNEILEIVRPLGSSFAFPHYTEMQVWRKAGWS